MFLTKLLIYCMSINKVSECHSTHGVNTFCLPSQETVTFSCRLDEEVRLKL